MRGEQHADDRAREKELDSRRHAASVLGSPVEELAAARTQPRNEVLEVGRSGGGGAENDRIERSASAGEQTQAQQAAADLEASVGNVLVRDAIGNEVQRRAKQHRRGA
jgi:hypothetical protein